MTTFSWVLAAEPVSGVGGTVAAVGARRRHRRVNAQTPPQIGETVVLLKLDDTFPSSLSVFYVASYRVISLLY